MTLSCAFRVRTRVTLRCVARVRRTMRTKDVHLFEREKIVMATNARTRSQANKATAPAQAAPAPSTDGKQKVDFLALVQKAEVAPSLPKIGGRGSGDNAFVAKVRESFESGQAIKLPAIPKEALTPVKVAIRRGATLAELGVSIREEETDAGIVLYFQGKTRNKRNTDDK